ncbi:MULTISPECIES: hypothetical protein [unclassified Microbacterium]|uniref:hypothetical protein n=1 Tax=unclassified Microbacterium TaxID=2609290 RepID=UPI0012FB28B1|nr:hypothetical protein [Microbacterium sp. MAH-37]MVQ43313.1 hypothetical protein [Microbacterium sp. MAH-37]
MRREHAKAVSRHEQRMIDLDPHLLAAYRVAVSVTSLEPGVLAARLAVGEHEAEAALESLAVFGFVTRLNHDPVPRYVAVSPDVAIGDGLRAREDALRTAMRDVAHLQEVYDLASAEASAAELGEVIEVMRGAEQVAQGFARIQASARREVCALVSNPVAVTSSAVNAVEDEAVARGVQYRVLIERELVSAQDGEWGRLREAVVGGEEVRVAERVPLKLTIVDRERAFLPVLADPERASAAALIVRPSALLTGLVSLFDKCWDAAIPMNVDVAPGLDDLGAQVLSLLMVGHTDEACARILGVSLRTVQRRVRELMEITGSQTRMQLGWHAAREGWLT